MVVKDATLFEPALKWSGLDNAWWRQDSQQGKCAPSLDHARRGKQHQSSQFKMKVESNEHRLIE